MGACCDFGMFYIYVPIKQIVDAYCIIVETYSDRKTERNLEEMALDAFHLSDRRTVTDPERTVYGYGHDGTVKYEDELSDELSENELDDKSDTIKESSSSRHNSKKSDAMTKDGNEKEIRVPSDSNNSSD